MKKALMLFTGITIFSMLLAACTLGSSSPTKEVVTEEPTQALATEEALSEPVAIDLVGPPMEVGSKYLYVDGTVLVAVPGGPFTMGYNFADNPKREVTVGDFWIYSTEVTNSQYALCVQSGKCSPPENEKAPDYGSLEFANYPVTGVNHTQASDYCAFVKGRLPTEAEWEKAARGPDGNIFPWGDGAPNCSLSNFGGCNDRTTPIDAYPDGMSYYELLDMGGNVREWVADWYEPLYNVDNPVTDPLGPILGEKRSVRSASFADGANSTIAAHRYSLLPDQTLPDLGFRCVVEDPINNFAPWCQMIGYVGTGLNGTSGSCTPDIKCNDVNISVSENCNPLTNTPYTIVVVSVDDPTLGSPNNGQWANGQFCLLIEDTPNEKKYLCEPDLIGDPELGAAASAFGACKDLSSCAASCPEYYTMQGDACVWDGGNTGNVQCLPGSTYDSLSQCCTAIPGTSSDISACPAGYSMSNGACMSNSIGVPENLHVSIGFASCARPTDRPDDEPGDEPGNPGGGCTLDENACRIMGGKKFDLVTCSCY